MLLDKMTIVDIVFMLENRSIIWVWKYLRNFFKQRRRQLWLKNRENVDQKNWKIFQTFLASDSWNFISSSITIENPTQSIIVRNNSINLSILDDDAHKNFSTIFRQKFHSLTQSEFSELRIFKFFIYLTSTASRIETELTPISRLNSLDPIEFPVAASCWGLCNNAVG